MRRLLLGSCVVLLLLMGGLAAGPVAAEPTGTLTASADRVRVGEPLTFTYEFPAADPTNWIGVYHDPGNGPVDEEYVGPSLVWQYVPAAEGTATFDTGGLEAGTHIAFALAQDGYAWLAQPVRFTVYDDEPLHFVTDRLPLRNARADSPYRADVSGLVRGDLAGATYTKIGGPSWLRVTRAGEVRGTPDRRDARRLSVAVVEVTNDAGETDTAHVEVDVRRPQQRLVPTLKVLSWNLWHGGTPVKDHREKQLRFLLDQDVDVVGVQESEGTSSADLGELLGWDHYQAGPDVGIISRYPIVRRGALPSESGLAGADATVRLDARRRTDVAVWSAHLGYTPYGPYDACFGQMTIPELLEQEVESGRTPQIHALVDAMRPQLRRADTTPVLLTGDFNAPSHLDWTPRTARCGYGDVPWPASTVPTRAGLVDTYREVNPDPRVSPGITWSPIYKTFTGGYGHDEHAGEPEPQDRIDFVYAAGRWPVLSSRSVVAGDPTPMPDHEDNEWTSDHAAVLTEFRVR